MNILIHGLGIIGGSMGLSLRRAGHTVFGMNRSHDAIRYALEHGVIDGERNSYAGADVVFLALPPRVAMRILDEGDFPSGCIVADICGVKGPPEDVVYSKARTYRYVGMHPMAGKETTGISSASVTLFDGANLVLTRRAETDGVAFSRIEALGREMGFGRIVVCTAKEHDEMIALTSQLAHIVSNGYVKSPLAPRCVGFTGGSFQDMTRVAPVDETVWTELFFLNREPLSKEIDRLCARLKEYGEALAAGDEEGMRNLLREGKAYHAAFSEKN